MAQAVDPLVPARAAFAERDWPRAYELLSAAEEEAPLPAEDFELLAHAGLWSLDPVRAIPLFERAYARHLEAGNARRAAFIAVTLAHDYGTIKLQRAIGNGWLNRAARLLADDPDTREHGYVALERSLVALNRGDYAEGLAQGRIAEGFGARHGDKSLEIRGIQRQGMALIERGDVEEGRALLDEASVAALGGELDPTRRSSSTATRSASAASSPRSTRPASGTSARRRSATSRGSTPSPGCAASTGPR